jgi:hypothetical protein
MKKRILMIVFILFIILTRPEAGTGPGLREDFDSLENWQPLTFPKIPRHSRYTILKKNSNGILVAEADNSASGIIYKKGFSIYKTPVIKWKWKISNIYAKGDEKKKDGDDYPLRIYVLFKYDPEKAGGFEKVQYNLIKLIYGEYPPHSGLNYIWANRTYPERILPNTYTKKAQMILMQKGGERAGRWINERVNALDDYREAFGTDPPEEAGLAIMSDADNTGEKATGYIDYIEVSAE